MDLSNIPYAGNAVHCHIICAMSTSASYLICSILLCTVDIATLYHSTALCIACCGLPCYCFAQWALLLHYAVYYVLLHISVVSTASYMVCCTAAYLCCEHWFIYFVLYCCMFFTIGTAILCHGNCCLIYYMLCNAACLCHGHCYFILYSVHCLMLCAMGNAASYIVSYAKHLQCKKGMGK